MMLKRLANTLHPLAQLSERAIELLALPDDGVPRLLLDIGCGSGLSGETLSENGHQWIGLDISPSMLDIALEREVEGDLLLGDMGQVPTKSFCSLSIIVTSLCH
ncbi:18S rRNA (guanine-N(7))-methyltransferase RID2-like, partial [Mangifera indica]|uniref:18S rRNA (guanine-N(7))-methyltransferase RID2-like n=1 Tax=Mangifera indica TaxID=29780 RepID=UPI001CFB7E14